VTEQQKTAKPLLAITQGDPTGIGPETIVGAWARPEMHEICRAVVVAHPGLLKHAAELLKSPATVIDVQNSGSWESRIESSTSVIPCLSCGGDEALAAKPATVDARGGQAAYDALVMAAKLALGGQVDGIVTAPLNKAALCRAGHRYPGHTELLAELCRVHDFAMMLYLQLESGHALGVVHVTLHMALADVFRNLTQDAIVSKAKLVDSTMRKLIGRPPRIGVCAINPHAGEEGLFGDEEQRVIRPAVEEAKRSGLDVDGPFPTDTLMVRARDGEFDAAVAMYHDQGHIALKLLGMHRAVNVTLGLPIVRTSVAHGTAFDLAWQGRAETTGMIAAIGVAAKLTSRRDS
jgi:4-hydroxythreonine-4-phosphate dehydrogenase